eukprot:gene7640-8938_t
MSAIPGNPKFQLRVEFSMLCRFYFGKVGYILAQIFINVSLQATNIASIIICSQVMDSLFIFLFKKTCGLALYPHLGWICVDHDSPDSSPFSEYYMLFTLGYLLGLDPSNMPALGTHSGMAKIFGNVIFNYAYITTLPSFINEAKSIWSSSIYSTVIFLLVGVFGSLAFAKMPSSSDILSLINSSAEANLFTKISDAF